MGVKMGSLNNRIKNYIQIYRNVYIVEDDMDYLQRKSLIRDLKEKLEVDIIGDIFIDEIVGFDIEEQFKYRVCIKNKDMNFSWVYVINKDIRDWDIMQLVANILKEYKNAIYYKFFFY